MQRSSRRRHIPALGLAAALAALANPAGGSAAEPPPAEKARGGRTKSPAARWFLAHGPRRHMFEVGAFGGLFLPSDVLELHDRNKRMIRYENVGAELGLRVGYYPLRHIGFEGELALMPTRLQSEQRALVSTARAHLVGQLGLYRLVPFVLVGGGVLTVRSEDNAIGNDADQALHFGGGAKLFLDRHIVLRFDVRDVMSPREGRDVDRPASSVETLLSFELALGPRTRKKKKEGPPDMDGDGKPDAEDACPDKAARTEDGCPLIDSDDDGFEDRIDECPEQAGAEPKGCPIPDTDDDGFLDPDDACPREPGDAPDGCPIRDEDGDGLLAPQDGCPTEAETLNGIEDGDGCPDELPADVQDLVGPLPGVEFTGRRTTLTPASAAALDGVVAALQKYPELRIELSGHTDAAGDRDANIELSRARAEAVKAHLVEAGIGADRIATRAAGPDEPIAEGRTAAARKQNRRIDLAVQTGTPPAEPSPRAEPAAPTETTEPPAAPPPADSPPPDDG